jgi:osmotically inducible protein OsmC
MPVNALYKTTATATGGGRDGKTSLDDGTLALQLVLPKELGGPGGDGANPEKLFARLFRLLPRRDARRLAADRH